MPAMYLLLVVALKGTVTSVISMVSSSGTKAEILPEYSNPPGPFPSAIGLDLENKISIKAALSLVFNKR